LATVPEGLSNNNIPCAGVLSVAGFSALWSLFPLGRRVYSEVNLSLFLLGFGRFLSLISLLLTSRVYSSLCRTALCAGFPRLFPPVSQLFRNNTGHIFREATTGTSSGKQQREQAGGINHVEQAGGINHGEQEAGVINGEQEAGVINGEQEDGINHGEQEDGINHGEQEKTVINGEQEKTVINGEYTPGLTPLVGRHHTRVNTVGREASHLWEASIPTIVHLWEASIPTVVHPGTPPREHTTVVHTGYPPREAYIHCYTHGIPTQGGTYTRLYTLGIPTQGGIYEV